MSPSLHENKIRVLVLGSPKVGKTSLINYFTRDEFFDVDEDTELSSQNVGVNIIVELEEGLQLDKARFAIEKAHAYILMYSVSDENSYGEINNVKNEINKIRGPGMPMVFVGNKTDLCRKNRRLFQTCRERNETGIPHVIMSVTEDINVRQVYRKLFQHETLKKLRDIVFKINTSQVFSNIRSLLLKAEAFEKSVASVFPKMSPKVQYHSNT